MFPHEQTPIRDPSLTTTFSFCDVYSPGTAGHDIVNVRSLEAVEGGGGSHGVSTHVLKDQPVTHLQVRQVTLLNNAIKAITRWAPDTAGVPDLIWLWLLLALRGVRKQEVNHYQTLPFTDPY